MASQKLVPTAGEGLSHLTELGATEASSRRGPVPSPGPTVLGDSLHRLARSGEWRTSPRRRPPCQSRGSSGVRSTLLECSKRRPRPPCRRPVVSRRSRLCPDLSIHWRSGRLLPSSAKVLPGMRSTPVSRQSLRGWWCPPDFALVICIFFIRITLSLRYSCPFSRLLSLSSPSPYLPILLCPVWYLFLRLALPLAWNFPKYSCPRPAYNTTKNRGRGLTSYAPCE